jgi:hypothetical protein
MRPLLSKMKPAKGFASSFHLILLIVLPAVIFVLVRLNFVQLALSMVVLSKWRMFAVKPRFWSANIRANAVDIIVGLSIVVFMTKSGSAGLQLGWAAVYGIWLIIIKPARSLIMMSVQAFIGQLSGLMALYLAWSEGPLYGITFLTALICYLAARHFFDSYNEPYARLLSYTWGYFGAALAWLLGHLLLFYGLIAQPTLILSALGYGLAGMYYLKHNDRGIQRQIVFIMLAVVVVILVFTDWGIKIV